MVMSILLAAFLARTIVPVAELPPSQVDPCAFFDSQAPYQGPPRLIAATDLVALADIGKSDPHPSETPFGISPDGTRIAFVVRRANAEENEYCQRLLVAPLNGAGAAREVDRGGAFIRQDFDLRKFVSIGAGMAKVITPRWSPNGRTIAYLKKVGSTQQVWIADTELKMAARQATALPDNIDSFAWVDNNKIIVATRPGIRQQAEAIARESRSGFLFDERFAPQMSDRPIPIEPLATEYNVVEIATAATSPATAAEIAVLDPERDGRAPPDAQSFTISRQGTAAWLEPQSPGQLLSSSGMKMRLRNGTEFRCSEACDGTRQLFWSADGSSLYAIQKSGWFDGTTRLLRWKVGARSPVQILNSESELIGCTMLGKELICAREDAVTPRRLVAIDPDTGDERLIYDPNPEFAHIKLGQVRRFRFRNKFGIESHADLVLPPDHMPGQKHPLVVVQYASVGFLRGGTGDEFPIQLLAAKGLAVLSFSRPEPTADIMPARTELELMQRSSRNWSDRRNVQSSIEKAIAQAIATGSIDAERVGISGFSDGGTAVQWALINSSLFKVAAIGTCCDGMHSFPLGAGPTFTQMGRDIGYGFFEPGAEKIWQPLSLTLNVDRIDAPILIQNTDSEYEGGLDVVEVFKTRGKAIEMFVFEGEPHVKYQPAHRMAMYERSTEWFQFWLMGTMNCDPAKAAQYVRWKSMKNAPRGQALRCEGVVSTLP